MMSSPRREVPLHAVLERENLGHKLEIFDYTHGHLNESKLYKPPDQAAFQSWQSANSQGANDKKRSKLPPTREELAEKGRSAAMEEAIVSFALEGVSSPRAQKDIVKKTPRTLVALKANEETFLLNDDSSGRKSSRSSDTSRKVSVHDGVFVEKLAAGEVQLPSQRYPNAGGDLRIDPGPERAELLKSQLLEPTRRRQFENMKAFEREVVRTQDTAETEMLSGVRAVASLEEKLRMALRSYDRVNSGPSFHRLQVYSAIFDELIVNSTLFGEFLSRVKTEYDAYVSHLLDLPPPQHRLLSMQLEQLLVKGTAQPEALSFQMERLRELEEAAKVELGRTAELREKTADLQAEFNSIPEPEMSLLRRMGNENEERTVSDRLEEMKADIWQHMDELQEVRNSIHAELVPSTVCAQLEQCCRETEVEVHKLQKQQEVYSQNNQEMETELKQLLEGWGLSPEEEEKMWAAINSPPEDGDDVDEDCAEEDESRWNWYIS